MTSLRSALIFGALALASATAEAQAPTRVRGTISAFDGKVLSVKSTDGKNADIQLGDKTEIVFTQPIALADIKPGDFLGVTSTKREDGTLTAFEVRPVSPAHRCAPRPLRGPERSDDDQRHGGRDGPVRQWPRAHSHL